MPVAAWLCKETIQVLLPPANASHDLVSSWLLCPPSPPPSTGSNKRKRSNSERIANKMSTGDLSPSKRRRHGEAEHSSCATQDVENTPRAKSNTAMEPPSPSSFTTSSRTTLSSHSRRSNSPKKKQPVRKMANLSLLPNPVVMKSIDDPTVTLPDELESMVLRLRRIGRGLGVIPKSEKVSRNRSIFFPKLIDTGCNRFNVLG